MARSIFIGPFHDGILRMLQGTAGVLYEHFELGPGVPNVTWAVAATMTQAGVDRLDVWRDAKVLSGLRESFGKRVKATAEDGWLEVHARLEPLFSASVETTYDWGADPKGVGDLLSYLTELLYAMRTGRQMVSLLPAPDLELSRRAIPLELWLPVKNLLDTAHIVTPVVVAPQFRMKRTDVALLDELLDGAPFARYVRGHADLNDVSIDPGRAADIVSSSADTLWQMNRTLLKHGRSWRG